MVDLFSLNWFIKKVRHLSSIFSVILCHFFFAGDDVKEKKPDPSIYITAAKVYILHPKFEASEYEYPSSFNEHS